MQERTRRAAAVGGFGLAGDAASGFENSKFDPQRPSNAAHTWTEGSVLLCRTGVPQIPAVIEIRRFPIIKIAPVLTLLYICVCHDFLTVVRFSGEPRRRAAVGRRGACSAATHAHPNHLHLCLYCEIKQGAVSVYLNRG